LIDKKVLKNIKMDVEKNYIRVRFTDWPRGGVLVLHVTTAQSIITPFLLLSTRITKGNENVILFAVSFVRCFLVFREMSNNFCSIFTCEYF
jgi:hypothetical protein